MRAQGTEYAGMGALNACREGLDNIRSAQQDLNDLRLLHAETPIWDRLRNKEQELKQARLSYLRALAASVEQMAGMPDGMRSVMWRSYVLGMSNQEVADSLHYAKRSVCRIKKRGIAWMERHRKGEG